MNRNTLKMAAENNEAIYRPLAYASLLNQGFERVVKVSKSSLELAVEQNVQLLASYRMVWKVPGFVLFNFASQAFVSYVALQRGLLGLAVGRIAIAEAKGNVRDSGKATRGSTNLILRSVDRTIATQRSILALTAKQSKTVSEQSGIDSESDEMVEDFVQLRADTLLAKEIVDLVVKQQPCDKDTPETDADIVQLRVNTLRAEESVGRVAKPVKTKSDPTIH